MCKSIKNTERTWKNEIVWKNIVRIFLLHVVAWYGLIQLEFANNYTRAFSIFYGALSAMGISAGAHRLWAHRSYKAKWQLRLFLMICNCIGMQDSVIVWVRDHRCHHKWVETDADPYNIKRGFFFAHVGWLLMKKRAMVKEYGSKIDISDLTSDPILAFQHRFYSPLAAFFSLIFPTLFCVLLLKENFFTAFTVAGVFRYCLSLHATWAINSVAHTFGDKPYDKDISATNNIIANIFAFGEGGHNFHHVYPQDYKTSEYPLFLNFATILINMFAKIGWAYDLKTVTGKIGKKKHIQESSY